MKKFMYLFAMLAIVGGLTACSDDNDDDKVTTVEFNDLFHVLSSQVGIDDSGVYSQCTVKNAVINETNKTLSITLTANVNGAYTQTLKLTDVKLVSNDDAIKNGWYEFKKDEFDDGNGNTVSNFKGYVDLTDANNCYFSYTTTMASAGSPKYNIEYVGGFNYGVGTTNVTVVDGGSAAYTTMEYQLTPDATGKTCTLTINNLVEGLEQSTSSASGKKVTFKNLPLDVTDGCYWILDISGKEYKSTDSKYTLCDFSIKTSDKHGALSAEGRLNINTLIYIFNDSRLFGASKLNF